MRLHGLTACAVVVVAALILGMLVVGMTVGEVMLLQHIGWNVPTQVYGILFCVNILLVAMAMCRIADGNVTIER